MRVKFKKGEQRKFLRKVLENARCPSLFSLRERGFEIPYSTLKNYFEERRTLPLNLFENLCFLAKLNKNNFEYSLLEDNWGKIKGGVSKKRRFKNKKRFYKKGSVAQPGRVPRS